MSASLALLSLLERQPAHGYTLKRRYDDRFSRARPLAFGQVYAALSSFERKGWAEVSDLEVVDGPERKRYRITGEGVMAVTNWVYTPQLPTEFVTSNLFARVSVALTSGRSPAEVLDRQRERHLARMRELTGQRVDAEPTKQLAITYELTHLDADLRWIDEAGQRLEALAADLTKPADAATPPRNDDSSARETR